MFCLVPIRVQLLVQVGLHIFPLKQDHSAEETGACSKAIVYYDHYVKYAVEDKYAESRASAEAEATKLRAIFLLSDGAPKRDGERLDVDPILEWVREANRFARIRLHTVGFEQAGSKMRKFMRRLAKQNHGDYVELK